MSRTLLASLALLALAPVAGAAHQLNVFASVTCEAVTVEAKFAGGNAAVDGTVRVLDGEQTLLRTLALGADGTSRIALDSVDHSGGLMIEVDVGSHDDYWIVTPEDIARNCGS